ncbi:MAG TPA: hemerythrin domain-containing protein [bacterium]|nr:hemerythrin domain-containing protein [bacterium]
MRREKFLWPLTQGHHGALVAARNIRARLSGAPGEGPGAPESLVREVEAFFRDDLEFHFKGEEEVLLKAFEEHVGPSDEGSRKIREDHRVLRELSRSSRRTDLSQFAEALTAHIRYEEDVFFPRVEAELTAGEKERLAEELAGFRPGGTHVPPPVEGPQKS